MEKKRLIEIIEKLRKELDLLLKDPIDLQDKELQEKSRELDEALMKLYNYLEEENH